MADSSSGVIGAAELIVGGIDLKRLFARGRVKYVKLVPFGQRDQPSVGRQDADLSAGATGQDSAVCFILGLGTQVPPFHLALHIQRRQLTIRRKRAGGDGGRVPRKYRGA